MQVTVAPGELSSFSYFAIFNKTKENAKQSNILAASYVKVNTNLPGGQINDPMLGNTILFHSQQLSNHCLQTLEVI